MRVLICAATPTELRACERGVADARLKKKFEFLKTGVGLANAEDALSKRLAKGDLPDLIVSSGFAGALDSSLPVGSWIVASRILLREEFEKRSVRAIAISKLRTQLSSAAKCSLISSSQLSLSSQLDKGDIQQIPPPVAVDMESAALAEIAEEKGIEFMVLRVITDSPQQPLPGFLSPFTAAMASQDLIAKLSLSFQGARSAVFDPVGIARLVKNGMGWSKTLRVGWRNYAKEFCGNVD